MSNTFCLVQVITPSGFSVWRIHHLIASYPVLLRMLLRSQGAQDNHCQLGERLASTMLAHTIHPTAHPYHVSPEHTTNSRSFLSHIRTIVEAFARFQGP
jgi:hypothetical protein